MSKTTEEKAQVMLDSLKPGAVLQYRMNYYPEHEDWKVEDKSVIWNWPSCDYRVVFMPRKIYVRQRSDGTLSCGYITDEVFCKLNEADKASFIEFVEVNK